MGWWPWTGNAAEAVSNSNNNPKTPQPVSQSTEKVEMTSSSPPGQCPVKSKSGGCPVKHSSSAPLNQTNMIPTDLDGLPAKDQKVKLDTKRQISSIPKSGESENWVYPSHQQFYNALKRKGHETEEDDIPMIVNIHNDMNDRCWNEILKWERSHPDHSRLCETTLKRFQGRPSDLTPKAFFLYHFGFSPRPFDRHDWIVDRCGKEVRYVIDYYGQQPDGKGAVMYVDARPAIDDFSSLMHRVYALWSSE